MRQVIRNGRVVLEDRIAEGVGIVLDGPAIEAILPNARLPTDGAVLDAAGCFVAPGFIDVHVHGGGGCSFLDATPQAIETACRTHLRHGTTTLLATLETAEEARMLAAIRALVAFARSHELGAMIGGINLEGPFLSESKAGAQARACLRPPDVELMERFLDAGEGLVKIVTLAPELPGADKVIRFLAKQGVVVAVGHSAATAEETAEGIECGIRLATHLYNAMSGLDHREPGVVGAVLDDERVWCELMCDGVHVAPVAARLAFKLKGLEHLVLVTDAIACLDGPREMTLFGETVVVEDGAARLPDGRLAGSVLTMERAVRYASEIIGIGLPGAVRMATRTPAALIGQETRIGRLDYPGARANLVFFGDDGSVVRTMLDGATVFEA